MNRAYIKDQDLHLIPEIRRDDQPLIFQANSDQGHDLLIRLRSAPGVRCVDTIYSQVQDLMRTRNPKTRFNALSLNQAVLAHLNGMETERYGTWVYFPWNRYLVHLLYEAEFNELRSNRNRNKITDDEQKKLRQSTIGIVGLSVGNAIAITLTMEGVYGHLILADFDRLDLSNLNRIHAGVQDLGTSKAILTARQIYQMNPFAQLTVFREGVDADNIENFFRSGGGVDCVIDECDDIAIKFKIRQQARKLGIPVLMSTSDRGMFDIERFDEQPDRPLFHGAFADQTPTISADMSNEEKLKFVLPILGMESVSTRAAASMLEIEESLSTWPQLAEDVMLGGAMTASAVRRLILGQPLDSGRFYLDLASFGNTTPNNSDSTSVASASASTVDQTSLPRERKGVPPPTWMQTLAEAASLAPSGGNCQPWAFSQRNDDLVIHLDRERGQNPQDPELKAAYLAVGAAICNAKLAACRERRPIEVHFCLDNTAPGMEHSRFSPIAQITCRTSSTGAENPASIEDQLKLSQQIGLRATNRQQGEFVDFPARVRDQLTCIASQENCLLDWIDSDEAKNRCARAIGLVDRIRFLCPQLHRSLMSELRWTTSQIQQTGDGIDIASLHLSALQQTVLHCLRRSDVVRELRTQGLGRRIATICRESVMQSSAVGMLSHRDDSTLGWVNFGQTLQHLWLQSTQQGWSWYPMTVVFILRYFHDELAVLFTENEQQELAQAASELGKLFPQSTGLFRGFLFCVRPATEIVFRSHRRDMRSCWISEEQL